MNLAYTFDDVLLLPGYADFERDDVNITTRFFDKSLELPIISSPMDTITEQGMIYAMEDNGGYGFHHRYCSLKTLRLVKGGIAVSPSMDMEKLCKYVSPTTVVLDVAHGHSKRNLEFCAELVRRGFKVVSGNIVTSKAVEDYLKIGVNTFRVGLGSGSVCSTRMVTGVGVPQAFAINTLRNRFSNITIISDGGHRTTGDIIKALALGADMVMLGGVLSGTDEVPDKGKLEYRGMASVNAQIDRGKQEFIEEGVSFPVTSKGSVKLVLEKIRNAIKLACYYTGSRNLLELRTCEKISITQASYVEGLPNEKLFSYR